jgi:hypothetical protein
MARTKQTARKRPDGAQPSTWVESAKRAKTEPAGEEKADPPAEKTDPPAGKGKAI